MTRTRTPSFNEEAILRKQGYKRIAGVDEVGRGALAGPVMAAAVILPERVRGSWKAKVRDSKLLTPLQREHLFEPISAAAIAVGIGLVDAWTIEIIGIARANQIAMSQAVAQLSPAADAVLIDYFEIPDIPVPQKGIADGDTLCFSIACASIVAKVTRDRIMCEFESTFPGYGFSQHKGYSTSLHLERLRALGPCAIHRHNFEPVATAWPAGDSTRNGECSTEP